MAIVKRFDARACNVRHAGELKWKANYLDLDDDDDDDNDNDDSKDESVCVSSSSLSSSATAISTTATGNQHRSNLVSAASSFALSLIAVAFTDHSRSRNAFNDSSGSSKPSTTSILARPSLCLLSLPKDVLANDILGFLTDKTVKKFLDSLGQRSLFWFSELGKQFCTKHGSRLEDPARFRRVGDATECTNTNTNEWMAKPKANSSLYCCPECYAEQQNQKRCNNCRTFYPMVDGSSSNNQETISNTNRGIRGGPGLWCQKCDRMAFCNACLSNDVDGCGSIPTPTATGSLMAFGAFGRKRLFRGSNNNNGSNNDNDSNNETSRIHYCNRNRITCHNYCCPNVFTNTMCGEFVCDDCGNDHQHLLKTKHAGAASSGIGDHDHDHTISAMSIESCDECGKATCLDPNCLVCADFRLIHISCSFVPEDAYKFDPGDLFFGRGKGRRTTCSADSSTRLRRIVSDLLIWMAVLFALFKMWWFRQQQ